MVNGEYLSARIRDKKIACVVQYINHIIIDYVQ